MHGLPVTGWVGKGVFRGFSSAALPCVVPCSSLFSALERSRSFSFFLFLFSLAVFSGASSGIWEEVSVAGSSAGEMCMCMCMHTVWHLKTVWERLTIDPLKGERKRLLKACKYINMYFMIHMLCLAWWSSIHYYQQTNRHTFLSPFYLVPAFICCVPPAVAGLPLLSKQYCIGGCKYSTLYLQNVCILGQLILDW